MTWQALKSLKEQVRQHWEAEPCGARYGNSPDRLAWFQEIEETRYRLQPSITSFAEFPQWRGRRVLEIGVGTGSDFLNWVRNGARAVGVDLTHAAVILTHERLMLESLQPFLANADAENLPFPDNCFDLVYSWGVLHHTPDMERALREILRVLRPHGVLKVMLYHVPSWTGWMLWARYSLLKLRPWMPPIAAIARHLESPGTRAYTVRDAEALLARAGFALIGEAKTFLSPGDLLLFQPSERYRSPLWRLAWRLYPRWLIKALGDRWGMHLLIQAKKPVDSREQLQLHAESLKLGGKDAT